MSNYKSCFLTKFYLSSISHSERNENDNKKKCRHKNFDLLSLSEENIAIFQKKIRRKKLPDYADKDAGIYVFYFQNCFP